jgi:hypothetical protein
MIFFADIRIDARRAISVARVNVAIERRVRNPSLP